MQHVERHHLLVVIFMCSDGMIQYANIVVLRPFYLGDTTSGCSKVTPHQKAGRIHKVHGRVETDLKLRIVQSTK